MEILTYGNLDEKAHISFRIVDLNGDSKITYSDFHSVVLRVLDMWYTLTGSQVKLPDKTIQSLFNKLDIKKKGEITADEYTKLLINEEVIFDWFDILNNEYLHLETQEEEKSLAKVDKKSIIKIEEQVTEMLEMLKSLQSDLFTTSDSVNEGIELVTKSEKESSLAVRNECTKKSKTENEFLRSRFKEEYDETTVRDEESETVKGVNTSRSLIMKLRKPPRTKAPKVVMKIIDEPKDVLEDNSVIPWRGMRSSFLLSGLTETKRNELLRKLTEVQSELKRFTNPTEYLPQITVEKAKKKSKNLVD